MPSDPAGLVSRVESLASRRVTAFEGGSLVWRVWGEGRPLVLLHGASGSWTHWIRNVLALAEHFRVLAPDMPGFGDSDVPRGPHTADVLADLVVAGLDVLVPAPAEVDVAGFSFGAIIAGLVAARLGGRVGTLALLGAGGLGLPPVALPPLRQLAPDMTPADVRGVHRDNLNVLMIASAPRIDDLAVFVQMENVRRARFKSGSIPNSDVLLKALPAIRARIAGIWAGRDAFTGASPERVEQHRQILASADPDLDFRVIADSGHWTPYEAALEVNEALLQMLRARRGRRPA